MVPISNVLLRNMCKRNVLVGGADTNEKLYTARGCRVHSSAVSDVESDVQKKTGTQPALVVRGPRGIDELRSSIRQYRW